MTTVRFVQTGGVAGLKLVADVRGDELVDLIDAALAEGAPTPDHGRARDALEYDITIEHDGHAHALHGTDHNAGPALKALAAALRAQAEPAP